ncbi:MAG: hypothetical protein WBP66_03975, partial [Azonexus sp.]
PGSMAKEQQQRANHIGAHAKHEAAPAFVSVRSARNFRQEVDEISLSLFSSNPEHIGRRKISHEHTKKGIQPCKAKFAGR